VGVGGEGGGRGGGLEASTARLRRNELGCKANEKNKTGNVRKKKHTTEGRTCNHWCSGHF
jgi:hypothetical protein